MTHPVTLTLALAATLSAAAAGAQTLPNQSAAATPTNVARAYVQTAKRRCLHHFVSRPSCRTPLQEHRSPMISPVSRRPWSNSYE